MIRMCQMIKNQMNREDHLYGASPHASHLYGPSDDATDRRDSNHLTYVFFGVNVINCRILKIQDVEAIQ